MVPPKSSSGRNRGVLGEGGTNNRDEDLCRRWDVLADEDHTLSSVRRRILLLQRTDGGSISTSRVLTPYH